MSVLTVKKAAPLLGISTAKLYQLVESRRIAHYRIDGKILLSEEMIRHYLDGCKVEKAEAPKPESPRMKLKHLSLS